MDRTINAGKTLIGRKLNAGLVVLLLFFSSPSAVEIKLRGIVVDSSKTPVSGVIVSLIKNALSDTTDAAGTFTLSSTTGVRPIRSTRIVPTTMKVMPGRIVFSVPDGLKAELTIYALNGARIAATRRSEGNKDNLVLTTADFARGVFIARATAGSYSKMVRFSNTGRFSSECKFTDVRREIDPGVSAELAGSVLDTLFLQRPGYAGKGIPLTLLTDTSLMIVFERAGPVRSFQSTAAGGLWFDNATWIGGIIPRSTDNVIIISQVQINVSGTDSAECRSMTVEKNGIVRAEGYSARTLKVFGSVVNYGDIRNGPDYASYDNATLFMQIGGNLVQDSLYRPSSTWFIGDSAQELSVGTGDYFSGSFTDKKSASPLTAKSNLVFRNFSLTFDTAGGVGILDMNDNLSHVKTDGFTVVNGVLKTNVIKAEASTNFTCPRVRSSSGATLLQGSICISNTVFDSGVVVDTGAILYNQANTDAVVTMKGDFINKGLTRRGPGYAAYGEGNLAVHLEKDFRQNGVYTVQLTRFTGASLHTVTVDSTSMLQGTFYSDVAAADIVAASPIRFNSFVLDFGTTNGRLVMGNHLPRIVAGGFRIKAGILVTSAIRGDTSTTTFTCPKITGVSGAVTLKGSICTDSALFDADVVVDTNAVFYNQANIDAVVTITGNFTNNGRTRRGPGYAAYGEGNLALLIGKNFRQNGIYTVQLTKFTGNTVQTIGTDSGKVLEGLFYDNTPLSGLLATTPLIITEAKFVLSPDTINKGSLSMDTFRLYHPSGNFQIDSGSLQVDSVTGGVDGNTAFSIRKITAKNGSLTVNLHYRTTSLDIAGVLVVDTDGRFYNQANVEARVTATSTTLRGLLGSGPGYAAYGEGLLFINGAQMPVWR